MQNVWWQNVTKANSFIHSITDSLLSEKSVVLSVPHALPWRDTFQEMIEEILLCQDPDNALECCDCPDEEPGQYLLNKYCKKEKRASYRLGMSYDEFLAKSKDIVLKHRCLWIRNLSKESMQKWLDFIEKYTAYLDEYSPLATFILEAEKPLNNEKNTKHIQEICFNNVIQSYDVLTFCILSCSEISIHSFNKAYLAEMVSNICGNDIELCARSIQHGENFLKNPVKTLQKIAEADIRSDGSPFEIDSCLENIENKIWESQLKIFFPIIEQYRRAFIEQYQDKISLSLPLDNNLGESVEVPQDVELGMLVYLVGQGKLSLEQSVYDQLILFKDARNALAHLRLIEYEASQKILGRRF